IGSRRNESRSERQDGASEAPRERKSSGWKCCRKGLKCLIQRSEITPPEGGRGKVISQKNAVITNAEWFFNPPSFGNHERGLIKGNNSTVAQAIASRRQPPDLLAERFQDQVDEQHRSSMYPQISYTLIAFVVGELSVN